MFFSTNLGKNLLTNLIVVYLFVTDMTLSEAIEANRVLDNVNSRLTSSLEELIQLAEQRIRS